MTASLHQVVGVIDVSSLSLDDLRPEDLGFHFDNSNMMADVALETAAVDQSFGSSHIAAETDLLAAELQRELFQYECQAASALRRTRPR